MIVTRIEVKHMIHKLGRYPAITSRSVSCETTQSVLKEEGEMARLNRVDQ